MLTPERLLRFTIELVFVLLGVLLIWLGVRGPIYGRMVDRHSLAWLILSIAIMLWGLRALPRRGQWWVHWESWTRGLSLVFLGILMLTIKWVPFLWVGPMLAAGGGILAARGLIACAFALRPR
ncbi:MAG TPA: hypothetical protein VE263_22445 [Candidatus Angelobacter sp.]|nr:hypothetical protein [Candidatus Angelobacter sp.]